MPLAMLLLPLHTVPLTSARTSARTLSLTTAFPLGRLVRLGVCCAAGLLGVAESAWAGAQKEEALADSVRTALSASVANAAPPRPHFSSTEERMAFLRWLGATSDKIRRRPAFRGTDLQIRREFLETLWYESKRAGLDPSLVLGLVEVESGFRKFAVSSVGARGFMQVMPFWARQIGDGDASRLFHMQTNMRFGCVILRHYIDVERGNLFMALGRYNGSRGRPQYPNAVFAAQKRYAMPADAPATRVADADEPARPAR